MTLSWSSWITEITRKVRDIRWPC